MNSSSRKILIIGIDGGTWDLLEPLMEEGVMPYFSKLCQKGKRGRLKSTVPPETPVAWSSFQTGVNPGKSGVIGFFNLSRDKKVSVVNSNSIGVDTFWEVLNKSGKRVVLLNVPMTYPPKKIDEAMVTGVMTPNKSVQFTYPKELAREVEREVDGYKIQPSEKREGKYASVSQIKDFVGSMVKMVEERTRVATYLMDRYDWDVFMVHFQAPDLLQHSLWSYLKGEIGEEKKKEALVFYEELDKQLRKLHRRCSQEPNLFNIIISDHGFQLEKKLFYLNKWLYDEGYLCFPKAGFFKRILGFLLPKLYNFEKKYLSKIDPLNLRNKIISHGLREKIKAKHKQDLMADMKKSKAFDLASSFYGMIFLNATGEEYLEERRGLIDKLNSLTDPENGNKVVERCYKKEELYESPPNGLKLPDIIVKPAPGYYFAGSFVRSSSCFKKVEPGEERTGMHHEDGIFVFEGKEISSKNKKLEKARIIDLAPTILDYFGIDIPDYMDGKSLKNKS